MSSATLVRAFKVPSQKDHTDSRAGNITTPTASMGIPASHVPKDEADLLRCLADPVWRLCSGQLYKIMTKEGTVVPFIPNAAQRKLMARLWHRNLILKARQLGFSTLVCIMWLDHALFHADQRCGIVAQDRDTAESLFRDKVVFAYDNLPEALRAEMPIKTRKAEELLFAHNNSSIKVATSVRGGTIHRLHVSEYGKICAKYPDKAQEVATGSLPAVPLDGIAIIESTAEGQEGDFHDKTKTALALQQQGRRLTQLDFRLHFFPWWQEPKYRMDPADVIITDRDQEYFATIEAKTGTTLDMRQRAWYVAYRESTFSGDPERMWQEYPSTPEEAFQVSQEGCYYALQLAATRKAGRICRVPVLDGIPVNTFWDIGNSDGTAIWLHQRVGAENRFIDFIEGWGEPYSHYIKELQARGHVWGQHHLPHDASHKRQQAQRVASPEDELREFKLGGSWVIVPRVDVILNGINRVREEFSSYVFDEERCALGIAHLGNYRKTWNKARGAWAVDTPSKVDGHSEAADALRQHAQGYRAPALVRSNPRPRVSHRAV